MRYEGFPFWQKGGREGIDGDISDVTDSNRAFELEGQVRGGGIASLPHAPPGYRK